MFSLSQKRCSKCGEVKPVSEFSPDKYHKDGLYSSCKKCKSEYTAAHRNKNKERVYESTRKWKRENKDKVSSYNLKYYTENLSSILERARRWSNARYAEKKSDKDFMETKRARGVRLRREIREKIFSILGDKCVRCGYCDKRALQVDHINGGGNKESRSMSQSAMYRKVIEVGKAEYQILCANCNVLKNVENKENLKRYD